MQFNPTGKELEMAFHKVGQIALIRLSGLPEKCTNQPFVYIQPDLFNILSLCFPFYGPPQNTYFPPFPLLFLPPPSIPCSKSCQNAPSLHSLMCPMPLGHDSPQTQKSGELLPRLFLMRFTPDPGAEGLLGQS